MLTLLTITLLLNPADEVPGCTKDTDCKGDRICSVEGRCTAPPVPEVVEAAEPVPEVVEAAEPVPAPVVRAHDMPPTRAWPAPRYESYRPHIAGGAAMLVVGTIGVVSGTALHFHHIHKLNTAPTPTWGTADRFAELAGNAPRVQAGVAVLISTGITLFVAGIVLCAIKEQRRVAYDPSSLAGIRF